MFLAGVIGPLNEANTQLAITQKYIPYHAGSRKQQSILHLLPDIELVSRDLELFNNNTTKVPQIIQTFLQCIIYRYAAWNGSINAASNHPQCIDLPYVWILRFIFASAGCGMEYPHSSTSGLIIRAQRGSLQAANAGTYFFMMIYRNAFPSV